MTVRVEADHIRRGIRGSCTWCPVAIALAEQYPCGYGEWWSVVGPRVYIYHVDGGEVAYELPRDAWERVIDFDRGRWIEPFEFTMERVR